MYTQHTIKPHNYSSLYIVIFATELQAAVALWSTQSNTQFQFNIDWSSDNKTRHTHTHIKGREKTDHSAAGEGVTKHATSEPFGTICH